MPTSRVGSGESLLDCCGQHAVGTPDLGARTPPRAAWPARADSEECPASGLQEQRNGRRQRKKWMPSTGSKLSSSSTSTVTVVTLPAGQPVVLGRTQPAEHAARPGMEHGEPQRWSRVSAPVNVPMTRGVSSTQRRAAIWLRT